MPPDARLAVTVDGSPLPEEEARGVWARFSAHMDAHPGDLAGFARAEGVASVHPAAEGGRAVLVVSRTEAQRPYGQAADRSKGGSTPGSPGAQSGRSKGKKRR
jgi:hypothetical protein